MIVQIDVNCIHHFEHQIYQRENAIFSNEGTGSITLRAQYAPNTTDYWYPGSPYEPVTCPYDYISGAIETVQNFKYGYFEMRASLPSPNHGNFPAFWMWSGTNRYNEIDIMENSISNNNDFNRIFGHYSKSDKSGVLVYDYWSNSNPLTNFHTYSIEWSPKMLIYYFDGIELGKVINEAEITNNPMPIKINYALDNYIMDPNHDNKLFPLDMVIDYVKVYQLNCDCNEFVNILNSEQLNGNVNSVKKNITINGEDSNPVILGTAGVVLRATDEIIINSNFTVPIGTNFYAMTHDCPQ